MDTALMPLEYTPTTIADFEAYIHRPENRDRDFEFIAGEIIDVVSNNYSSLVAMKLGGRLSVFVEDNDLGYVTGADGGYIIGAHRFIPDVAFISKDRQPKPNHDTYNPNAPDLAVEVLSPTDDRDSLRVKIAAYLAAGTVLWVVDPAKKRVEILIPGVQPMVLDKHGIIDGGEVLPGFTLAVEKVFPTA